MESKNNQVILFGATARLGIEEVFEWVGKNVKLEEKRIG